MSTCNAVGALTVGGREVAAFRCELDAGHSIAALTGYRDYPGVTTWIGLPEDWPIEARAVAKPSRHRHVLEWADSDDVMILPEAELFDPDERFDVELPFPE